MLQNCTISKKKTAWQSTRRGVLTSMVHVYIYSMYLLILYKISHGLSSSIQGQRRYEMITCSDKNAVSSPLSPHTLLIELQWRFLRVIPMGSPSKNGMTVISNRNYNVWARGPLRIPQSFSFNTATVWGHAHDDAHWYAQKSRGGIAAAFENVWEAEECAMKATLAYVYFLAKEEIPHTTKYEPVMKFLSDHGLPHLEGLNKEAMQNTLATALLMSCLLC